MLWIIISCIWYQILIPSFASALQNDGTNINLALGKPAGQIGFHTHNGIPLEADLAVDGNFDSDLDHMSCSHTRSVLKPWWKVDLGDLYLIKAVEITNRLVSDGGTAVLRNFKIETALGGDLTDNKVSFRSLCFYQPGAHTQKSWETVLYTCNRPVIGRLVRIQIQNNGTSAKTLELCEVRVFGVKNERQTITAGEKDKKSNSSLISTSETPSKLFCVAMCLTSSQCTSVNVRLNISSNLYICEHRLDEDKFAFDKTTDNPGWIRFIVV